MINEKDLSEAFRLLHNGSLVVYPTDTLYALGADVFNTRAVEKVFKIKKRPLSVPLPIAVSCIDMMEDVAFVNDEVRRLASIFLPGSLTLILKKKNSVSDIVTSNNSSVAVRIPDNDIALKLISDFGPLTVTSANVHGDKTPGIIKDIRMRFKQDDIAFYLDYGKLEGKPSTIVDLLSDKVKIVREGAISIDKIMEVI